jgi:Leucine-rich repeat (LRR) protein
MLQHNELSWVVPASLGMCAQLTSLDLSHNHFRGELPSQTFGTLGNLTNLNVSSNLRICGEVSRYPLLMRLVSCNI